MYSHYLGEPWEIRKFQKTVQSSQPSLSSTECLMDDISNSIKEANQPPKDSVPTKKQLQKMADKKIPDNTKNIKQMNEEKSLPSSSISPKTTQTLTSVGYTM